jgi:chromosome segregation protein
MGEVNLASLEEHGELSERHAFLTSQKEDLESSLEDLTKAIQRINRTTRERFSSAFDEINAKFSELFPRLFQGGRAQLRLLEEDNLLESGVEIFVQLPGRRRSRSTASPAGKAPSRRSASSSPSSSSSRPRSACSTRWTPAGRRERRPVQRHGREMSSRYQFLIITHNKRTMELADVLYGITMEKPGSRRPFP